MVNWREARNKLRAMREEQSTDSKEIIKLAEPLLQSSATSLGVEVWAIYEQACTAALDCAKDDLAREYHKKLEDKFGSDSTRVGLLKGQILEAEEKWDEADKVYSELLKINPVCANAMKRQVAMLIAKQEDTKAIEAMNKYLENFMGDFEAWMELGFLYLKQNHFSKAQFCFEELVLSNPYNYVFHEKLAEIVYTQGGNDNYNLAKKHFAQALKLNPHSARAMFGLLLVTKKLENGKTSKQSNMISGEPVMEFCESELRKLHGSSPHTNTKVLDSMLKSMCI